MTTKSINASVYSESQRELDMTPEQIRELFKSSGFSVCKESVGMWYVKDIGRISIHVSAYEATQQEAFDILEQMEQKCKITLVDEDMGDICSVDAKDPIDAWRRANHLAQALSPE